MKGTTPRGAATEREASEWVRDMFARVAPRYDLANRLLSFRIDQLWRARTVARTRHILARPGTRALDLCCGTGDLTLALARASASPVLGCDFCHPMLAAARDKVASRGAAAFLFEGDALRLPLPDGTLDLVTVAFGFRNLANYAAGLAEMHRVLRPGGTAAILEFSRPPNPLFRGLYNFYSSQILPLVGGALSGSRDAYTYLPESVRRFPSAPELAEAMRLAGFAAARFELFTGGIVALHLGEK